MALEPCLLQPSAPGVGGFFSFNITSKSLGLISQQLHILEVLLSIKIFIFPPPVTSNTTFITYPGI